ncbi:MAG: hypothetical protein SVX38_14510, partial [Chloroflexota bacterium]|nr:hypothetical protein [Chloroflexota bacterium]
GFAGFAIFYNIFALIFKMLLIFMDMIHPARLIIENTKASDEQVGNTRTQFSNASAGVREHRLLCTDESFEL